MQQAHPILLRIFVVMAHGHQSLLDCLAHKDKFSPQQEQIHSQFPLA
jgi:hypothetical protein